jgi:hypothetical protein
MTVYVTEHYRPVREKDQMLLRVENINYVTKAKHGADWMKARCTSHHYPSDGMIRIITNCFDIRDLPDFINDFVFYESISKPCNLTIYSLETMNIGALSTSIRDILENNLW